MNAKEKKRFKARKKDLKRRHRRKIRSYAIYYVLISILICSVLAVLTLTVFFKINKIEVLCDGEVNSNAIILESSIKKGSNLIVLNSREIERKILLKDQSIDFVKIKKIFPDRVAINCSESRVRFSCLNLKDEFVYVTRNGRIAAIDEEEAKEGTIVVKFNSNCFEGVKVGDFMKLPTKEKTQWEILRKAINQSKLSEISEIEFLKTGEIKVVLEDRIFIEIKDAAKAEFILKSAAKIKDYIGMDEKIRIKYNDQFNRFHAIPIHEKKEEKEEENWFNFWKFP